MLSSLYSGTQGLRVNTKMLGIIGTNVSNVNTIAYKAGEIRFANVLGESIAEGGVKVWGMNQIWSQGSVQHTSSPTDLAIVGKGLFIVQDSDGEDYYMRAGAFHFDKEGYLVNDDGLKVQGYTIESASGTQTLGTLGAINPTSLNYPPNATSEMEITMNLDAATAASGIFSSSVTVYDSLGNDLELTLTFEKTGAGTWEVTPSVASGTATDCSINPSTLVFGDDGKLTSPTGNLEISITGLKDGAADMTIGWVPDSITQYAAASSVTKLTQDGYGTGSVTGVQVGDDGVVTAIFSNGKGRDVYQLALAAFANYGGLNGVGNNLYAATQDSGEPVVGTAKTGGRGAVSPKSLEMSNVDLVTEFVNMITTQRAYQANAKVLTTSDQILQELINIKR